MICVCVEFVFVFSWILHPQGDMPLPVPQTVLVLLGFWRFRGLVNIRRQRAPSTRRPRFVFSHCFYRHRPRIQSFCSNGKLTRNARPSHSNIISADIEKTNAKLAFCFREISFWYKNQCTRSWAPVLATRSWLPDSGYYILASRPWP